MKRQYPLGFFQNEETLSNALLPLRANGQKALVK